MTGLPLIIAFVIAIVLMILLISKLKVHPFLAIMAVSLLLAIVAGIPLKASCWMSTGRNTAPWSSRSGWKGAWRIRAATWSSSSAGHTASPRRCMPARTRRCPCRR